MSPSRSAARHLCPSLNPGRRPAVSRTRLASVTHMLAIVCSRYRWPVAAQRRYKKLRYRNALSAPEGGTTRTNTERRLFAETYSYPLQILFVRAHHRVLLTAVALCIAMPALAATSTPYAKGGRTRDFAVDVERYRRSGEPFRITGHCQSACTMFLALPNVCVEPSARLLFHAAKTSQGTRDMLNSYSSKLRSYLIANHIMESPVFHTITGRDMVNRFGYRPCRRSK